MPIEVGCDEAGRGCLAGPVSAAAVILPDDFSHPLLNDSKLCSPEERAELRVFIEEYAIDYAVAFCCPKRIDEINILKASFEAMHKAIRKLVFSPDLILVDGNQFVPYGDIPFECIIKGDAKFSSIAAASILAKTYRDELMQSMHNIYPFYSWDTNKGYPTEFHRNAILQHGLSPIHRHSFKQFPLPEQLELF